MENPALSVRRTPRWRNQGIKPTRVGPVGAEVTWCGEALQWERVFGLLVARATGDTACITLIAQPSSGIVRERVNGKTNESVRVTQFASSGRDTLSTAGATGALVQLSTATAGEVEREPKLELIQSQSRRANSTVYFFTTMMMIITMMINTRPEDLLGCLLWKLSRRWNIFRGTAGNPSNYIRGYIFTPESLNPQNRHTLKKNNIHSPTFTLSKLRRCGSNPSS